MSENNCPICDCPQATDEDWRNIKEGQPSNLCWGGQQCQDNAVDWRKKALEAEELCDLLRAEIDQSQYWRHNYADAVKATEKERDGYIEALKGIKMYQETLLPTDYQLSGAWILASQALHQ